METRTFPNCCSATVIVDFGQTSSNGLDRTARDITKEKIIAYLQNNKFWSPLLVAIVNESQEAAIEAFKELGWEHSKWSKQGNHGKKVRLYWKLTRDA